MASRDYKSIGKKVFPLGFGCMRLPRNEDGTVNRLKTTRLIREACRNGVNYFDTAYGYHGGQSEVALGIAVKPFRDKVVISTKNPIREDDTQETWLARVEETCERLGGPPDILNYHCLNWQRWTKQVKPKRKGLLAAARKGQERGLFKHLAFSCHDTPENMIKLLDTGEFVGITLQYNLLDRRQEGVIEHADKKGLGAIVMGPVGGGRLAVPSDVLQSLIPGKVESTPEIAMRFVLANPHVTCAISGMNERAQLMENLKVARMKKPLDAAAKRKVKAALKQIEKFSDLYCTGCGYCMPCPHHVNIAQNFTLMNLHRMWGLTQVAKQRYARLKNPERGGLNAAHCKKCGKCMPKCPQNIDIIKQLEEVDGALG